MKINWNTKLYCLIGNPIDGTYSPIIHNFIYNNENINNVYMSFNIDRDKLDKTIEGLLALDVKGFNITSPFKEDIIPYLDEIVEGSKKIGAINTVKNKNGKLIGTNTDGLGFIKMLYDNNINLKNKKILIIGAGGAAKGITYELIKEDFKKLTIINRTKDKAIILKEELSKMESEIEIQVLEMGESINRAEYDILINTTILGMEPYPEYSPIDLNGFKNSLIVCDIIYKPLETKLLYEAKTRGLRYYNGIDMLVNQAVLAQEFWLGHSLSKESSLKTIKYIKKYLEED